MNLSNNRRIKCMQLHNYSSGCFITLIFILSTYICEGRLKLQEDKKFKGLSSSIVIPKKTRFCLVHVGKTAGTSVRCELGIDEEQCQENIAPSGLSNSFSGYAHQGYGFDNCRQSDISALVYTMRNPFDRLVSWFFYEHPRRHHWAKLLSPCSKQLHKWKGSTNGCFSNLEEFSLHVTPPPSTRGKDYSSCHSLAWQVASGLRPCAYHNYYNYEYYHQGIKNVLQFKNAGHFIHTLALRSDNLPSDWDVIDRLFGGESIEGNVNGTVRFRNVLILQQTKHMKTKEDIESIERLSGQGRKNICHALCLDIQFYKKLLIMAENLDDDEVKRSMKDVINSCPDETFEIRDCPHNIANRTYSFYSVHR